MEEDNYLIVIGTNRVKSRSSQVGEYYQRYLKSKNITPKILNLIDLPRDFIFENVYGKKLTEFRPIQEQVNEATKFIFIIPEYNGSFPGVLKAFIDACDFPQSFSGKKCCLVGLSAGQFGNVRGLEHFSGIANYIKMDVYHNSIYLPGITEDLDEDNEIDDPTLVKRIQNQINGFLEF